MWKDDDDDDDDDETLPKVKSCTIFTVEIKSIQCSLIVKHFFLKLIKYVKNNGQYPA
jgi:hypothetical protein